jgi:hypothetical protein
VSGCINDQKTGDLEVKRVVLYEREETLSVAGPDITSSISTHLVDHLGLLLDGAQGEVGGTDLLSDTTCLTFLNVGLTNLQEEWGHNQSTSKPPP